MKDRWLPVGLLAGALFAVNVVARLITTYGFDDDTEASDRVSLVMFVVIGLTLAVVAFIWGRRWPTGRWAGDIAVVVLAAMALTVFIGPFVSGGYPFDNGAGAFFAQIWLYSGCALLGTLLGFLVLTALGLDYRSVQLKLYAERKQAKPRRVVRR